MTSDGDISNNEVIFVCGDGSFQIQLPRSVAKQSTVVKSMLESDFSEALQGRIMFPDFTPEVLAQVNDLSLNLLVYNI